MLLTICTGNSLAQSKWPKSITAARSDIIKIYQPQPETFKAGRAKTGQRACHQPPVWVAVEGEDKRCEDKIIATGQLPVSTITRSPVVSTSGF